MNLPRLSALAAFLAIASVQASAQRYNAASLSPNARQLFDQSMQFSASCFDAAAHLLRPTGRCSADEHSTYTVRDSSWYATGLLARDAPGDRATAAAILEAVLANQYLDPGVKWFGTFKRSSNEPLPGSAAYDFGEYDPNWREFIGTIFELVLTAYPDRLPAPLRQRLYKSIDTAILGEQQEGRLSPSYTNIALMYGSLWDFAATHNADPKARTGSAAWVAEVNRLFRLHDAFNEFNSPTYYGVDLFGLALWRDLGSSPAMRSLGSEMEATLWNQIADFYQPALRNIAGPYDRSYGMDMESYVAVTGVWLRSVLPEKSAPLPLNPTPETDHVGDFYFASPIVLLGAHVPPAAMARLTTFAGPHLVTHSIDDKRTATAWLGLNAIWGAESTSLTRDVSGTSQFHPVTVQWRTPAGDIGWINLTRCPKIDAVADKDGITITTDGDIDFLIQPGPGAAPQLTATTWTLPGMTVSITTDATFSTHPAGPGEAQPPAHANYGAIKNAQSMIQANYIGVKHMRLLFKPSPAK